MTIGDGPGKVHAVDSATDIVTGGGRIRVHQQPGRSEADWPIVLISVMIELMPDKTPGCVDNSVDMGTWCK